MITISPTHFSEICQHGSEAYPYECCGALLGQMEAADNTRKVLQTIIRLENSWQDSATESRHRRFAITTEDYRRLEKEADGKGQTLLGFYHTHPDHPALPSAIDLSYAWPFFSYIILSVRKGKAEEMKSFELSSEKAQFIAEELKINRVTTTG